MTPAGRARRRQSARALAEVIGYLGRWMNSRAVASGLNLAQWSLLRYLQAANPSARTVGAFARYNLTTPSSASQSVDALVRIGLIIKRPAADKRVKLIELTGLGRKRLERSPMGDLAEILAALPARDLEAASRVFEKIVRNTSAGRRRPG